MESHVPTYIIILQLELLEQAKYCPCPLKMTMF